jgi:DNA repair exonuclease SbcCD ATPase subunit
MHVARSDSVSSVSSVSSNPSNLPKHPMGSGEVSSLEWKLDNKCFICNKKFGLGARHHCRYCGNSVCGKHSLKKKVDDSGEKTRICENCDVELIKKEIRAEIYEELAKINDNIEIVRENYEKTEEERQSQAKIASEVEEQMISAEKEFRAKEAEMNKRLNDEILNTQKKDLALEIMRKEFDESRNNTKEGVEKQRELEAKIEGMRNEITKLRQNKREISENLERANRKILTGLPQSKVAEKLCETCKERVLGSLSVTSSFNE